MSAPKDLLTDVAAFEKAASSANTVASLSGALEASTRDLGYRWFTLIRPDTTGNDHSSFLLTNYPEGWVEQVLTEKRYIDDPIHAAVMRSIDGVQWGDVGVYINPTVRQLETMAKARDFGLKNGFTFPYRFAGLNTAMFSVAQARTRPMTRKMRIVAHMLGAIAFRRAHELSFGTAPSWKCVQLTPRQIDCIALVAQGQSDFEIARRMDISPHSVRDYIEAARERYGVKRRIQLTLAALRDGYISLENCI